MADFVRDRERVAILNAAYHPVTLTELAREVLRDLREGNRGWISTVNVAITIMMRDDPFLQSYVDRSRWVIADGQPIVWASRRGSHALPERVTGVDLVELLCEGAAAQGTGVYLLGGERATVDELAERILRRAPGLQLSWNDGYFDSEEAPQRAADVRASGAKLLLVGMGVPRQEHFIDEHFDDMGVTTAIGVGGSFDVLAGRRRRAPLWVQRCGLEWMFRLVQEPRRLFRRYLVTNSRFAWAILGETLRKGQQQ